MLFLDRKLGEKIYIDGNICLTVVDIDRGKIRLGIDAPKDVPIFREELLTGVKRSRRKNPPALRSGTLRYRFGRTPRAPR